MLIIFLGRLPAAKQSKNRFGIDPVRHQIAYYSGRQSWNGCRTYEELDIPAGMSPDRRNF